MYLTVKMCFHFICVFWSFPKIYFVNVFKKCFATDIRDFGVRESPYRHPIYFPIIFPNRGSNSSAIIAVFASASDRDSSVSGTFHSALCDQIASESQTSSVSRSPSLYTHVLLESYVESSKLLEFTTYVYIKLILTTGYGTVGPQRCTTCTPDQLKTHCRAPCASAATGSQPGKKLPPPPRREMRVQSVIPRLADTAFKE